MNRGIMSKSVNTDRELWRRVYKMYMVDNIPIGQIANELGYSQDEGTNHLCKKFGIPSRRRNDLYNPLAKQMFTDEQEQILLGGLLGDGCIVQRNSRNCEYKETHSVHQLEYINWKQVKLYPFVPRVTIGHKGEDAFIKSVALPQLGFYRGAFYPNDKKIIPVESLQWLDNLALAVWYMDDGSRNKSSGQITFATCAFNLGNVGMLQGWLATKYNILSYLRMDRGIYPRIELQRQSNDKFLSTVEPYIIPSMRYKLGQ